MSNQFWSNFFRKDLNLGGRWWHRLFLVIFFACFVWALYMISADNYSYIPQWKMVSSIEERIMPEVKQVRDLKKPGEQVGEKGSSYALNLFAGDSLYDDFYCSTDLENKIPDIQSKSGITNLYLNRNSTKLESFVNYIRENNIKCLISDSYSYSNNTKLTFLEPFGPDSIYGKNLVFYEKSNFLTIFYILKIFLFVLAVFVGIVIAYYKGLRAIISVDGNSILWLF